MPKKIEWGSYTSYEVFRKDPDLYFSPTDLLRFAEIPWSPGAVIDLAEKVGLVDYLERPSSTRPGVIRREPKWTEAGLVFGANVKGRAQDRGCEMRFRASRFHELMEVLAGQLAVVVAESVMRRDAQIEAMNLAWQSTALYKAQEVGAGRVIPNRRA